MAPSSRSPTHDWRLCAVLLALASSGCFTGRLFEAGRVRESVLRYRAVALAGETLRVDYTVELGGALGAPTRESRTATFSLALLTGGSELPVDAFPLVIRRAGSARPAEVPLPFASVGSVPHEGISPADVGGPFAVALDSREERDAGFQLCRPGSGACLARFHSEALYRDRTAWWVYPLAPVTVGVDLALLPLQIMGVGPFFLAGD